MFKMRQAYARTTAVDSTAEILFGVRWCVLAAWVVTFIRTKRFSSMPPTI